jgi:hypothetical protein
MSPLSFQILRNHGFQRHFISVRRLLLHSIIRLLVRLHRLNNPTNTGYYSMVCHSQFNAYFRYTVNVYQYWIVSCLWRGGLRPCHSGTKHGQKFLHRFHIKLRDYRWCHGSCIGNTFLQQFIYNSPVAVR